MKHLFTFIFITALLASSAVAQAQQTPANTSCNDESKLQWTMGTETDLKEYRVYAANTPIDPTVDNSALILMTVPQPTSGSDATQLLNSTLAEGDKYFRVTAVDNTGNESPMSMEVGCHYNLIPSAPGNVTIILKQKP
jgi:hypothetical protein